MANSGIYTVRAQGSPKRGYASYTVGLPKEIGELVCGRQFTAEFTSEGILLRLASPPPPPTSAPQWLT